MKNNIKIIVKTLLTDGKVIKVENDDRKGKIYIVEFAGKHFRIEGAYGYRPKVIQV
jgi:hypothetical protein